MSAYFNAFVSPTVVIKWMYSYQDRKFHIVMTHITGYGVHTEMNVYELEHMAKELIRACKNMKNEERFFNKAKNKEARPA